MHGRSVGGVIATHLARRGYTDFLFADRTFSSLGRVTRYTIGKWAQKALPMFTFKSDINLVNDYIYTSCYKVMGNDVNDEVINDIASLKCGVAAGIA